MIQPSSKCRCQVGPSALNPTIKHGSCHAISQEKYDEVVKALGGLPTTNWYDHSTDPPTYERHLSACPKARALGEYTAGCEDWCQRVIGALTEEGR